ncbi:MAG: hypothetical protein Q8O25_15300 [Sulfurisoma sp.]|nr:hypothetical protein [Sulfurisoma sp.]
MRRSLIWAGVLLVIDAGIFASFIFSALICPLWLLASAVASLRRRPGWRVALARLIAPALTLMLVAVNASVQTSMAQANADRIVQAIERFHQSRGTYPARLTDLIPAYLDAVPPAKYSLTVESFTYRGLDSGRECMLSWVAVPPFGRRVYTCQSKKWSTLD